MKATAVPSLQSGVQSQGHGSRRIFRRGAERIHHPLNGRHILLNSHDRPLTQPAQPVVAAAAAAAEQRRRQPQVALELLRRLPAEPPRYRVASAADASHAAYAPVGRKPRFIAPRHAARVAGRRLDAAVADVCREHRPLRHRSHR